MYREFHLTVYSEIWKIAVAHFGEGEGVGKGLKAPPKLWKKFSFYIYAKFTTQIVTSSLISWRYFKI